MIDNSFSQHIKETTRKTLTAKSCLDLIFTNFTNKQLYASVEEFGISDHASTILHLEIQQNSTKSTWHVQKRLFHSKNIDNFKEKLKTINWDSIIDINSNINENYNSFK